MVDKYEGSIGARATVTIEIGSLGSWGTPYTMEQIIDQAGQTAVARIRKALASDGGVKIIGEPEVTAVYAPGKKITGRPQG